MWKATAPANIALIKYMGKTAGNLPTNASLSYSLAHLITEVRLSEIESATDRWQSLQNDGFQIRLSPKGETRFLRFFDWLKQELSINGNFLIQSGNNFPSDCGLASSASSFAALTKAASLACGQDLTAYELSRLARHGSGSSCRSFFEAWALWQGEGAEAIDLPCSDLLHQVIVVESSEKAVSSSEAHARVAGSALFSGRSLRAEARLKDFVIAMRAGDWQRGYEVAWQEFWDMHALFETSAPPFGYFRPTSIKVLNLVRSEWKKNGDGPLVTMDAGPNVHLLYRADQKDLARRLRAAFATMEISTKVIGNDVETL